MLIGHPIRMNKIETIAPLKLNGTEINRVKKTKSLGIFIFFSNKLITIQFYIDYTTLITVHHYGDDTMRSE